MLGLLPVIPATVEWEQEASRVAQEIYVTHFRRKSTRLVSVALRELRVDVFVEPFLSADK